MSVTEDAEHGFIRLADRAPHNPPLTAETSPQPLLNDASGIHVRTDFYVGAYDRRVELQGGEA